MATITGLTADRMLAIEAASIVDGEIIAGNLILSKHDGNQINAGPVVGPQGATGQAGPMGFIPGQIITWPGTVLPAQAQYGHWVWCNGGIYSKATYPIATSHIASAWDTAMGQAAPPAGQFRVPDLRGLVPAGMDAMPVGAARASRVTRAAALIIATKTGEETHAISITEMALHSHPILPLSGHIPLSDAAVVGVAQVGGQAYTGNIGYSDLPPNTNSVGGGTAHETMQPTIFVSYIVKLDD
jgi:microcystin-dependent protein